MATLYYSIFSEIYSSNKISCSVKQLCNKSHAMFIFLGIAPGQGKKLFKLIQEPSDLKTTSCDLERAVVNLYMESRDKDIKKQLLSLISLSHTKKELQQLIPQLSVYAINEARKHALDQKEGRFSLNTMNNVSN